MEENKERNIIHNKVVLVTGGSKGIGAAIVKYLSENSYQVILNYNKSEESATEIKKELKEKNVSIDIIKADVSNKEEVDNMVNEIIKKYHRIDVLINNAGISQEKLFLDTTREDWGNMINVNLNSVYNCTKAVLPNMLERKSGSIINISSIWGVTGASCEVAYSTTKAAINGFTKALAKEMGLSNIRINSIAPGIIDTDMNKNLNEQELNEIKEQIPLNKIGKPKDIAKCVQWLIEDEYTTGQVININGGWLM